MGHLILPKALLVVGTAESRGLLNGFVEIMLHQLLFKASFRLHNPASRNNSGISPLREPSGGRGLLRSSPKASCSSPGSRSALLELANPHLEFICEELVQFHTRGGDSSQNWG